MQGITTIFGSEETLKKDRLISDLGLYNWKELNQKYKLKAKSESELLLRLIESKGVSRLPEILDELRGDYAFAYRDGNFVYLARDIIGVKPLWHSTVPHFACASEKKTLASDNVEELNPREILRYDLKTGRADKIKRDFFSITPEVEGDVAGRLKELLFESVKMRIPDSKFGLLLSGGVDSSTIAKILQELGAKFTCYTAALDENARDLKSAKRAADAMGLAHRSRVLGIERMEEYMERVVPLIEEPDVIKIGVALPTYVACEMAQEDGCEVLFYGAGSDELFGGYSKYRDSKNLNEDCRLDILGMHRRNTYRDYVTAASKGLELRAPYLDTQLVDFALKIPASQKIRDGIEKAVLREVAEKIGLVTDIAWAKKRAAQYGSRFDWGLEKLAKRRKLSKSDYVESYAGQRVNLGVLFSSGKDSTYAMHIMKERGHPISCLISIESKNPDSYMFHTPNISTAYLQSEALGIPHMKQATKGVKEEELADLEHALKKAQKKYRIEGVVTGALYSVYQKERIEAVCDRMGLQVFSPLWHMDQEQEMRQVVKEFEFVFSSVAAQGLDSSWLGRRITQEDVDRLVELDKKFGINIAGEGGEFESLVLDAPMFKKRMKIDDFEIIEESESVARMVVKRATLAGK